MIRGPSRAIRDHGPDGLGFLGPPRKPGSLGADLGGCAGGVFEAGPTTGWFRTGGRAFADPDGVTDGTGPALADTMGIGGTTS